ncbi:MAG TPA: response regulator [Candidatus Saccharimonadales bacterium]|nr:response regulator [Candidatus Saccharimonadales bacterium]
MPPTKRVLIVEDERPLSHALELKLQHEGWETVTAFNGQECVDAVGQQHFDVVLLDLMMPVMDGFQVLQQLQSMPNPPVVFVLSNLSQHEDEERVLSLGAKKFFIKSDTPLSTIVEEVKKTTEAV